MPAPFVKYFSAVPGHVVSRFGSARQATNAVPIGYRRVPLAARDPDKGIDMHRDRGAGELEIQPHVIAAITAREWARFSREYTRALKNGALRERTEAEYLASIAAPSTIEEPDDELEEDETAA